MDPPLRDPKSGNLPAALASKEEEGKDLEAEFEHVLRREGPKIYSLAVRLSGNPTDGEDLAQDTFLQAHRHWARFRGESQVGTWLYRVCVNLWKNRVKYEKRRYFWRHISLFQKSSEEEDFFRDLPSGEPPVDHSMTQIEAEQALTDALNRLTPEDRALILLRDKEDRSYEELAEWVGVPLGTVKSRLARAREKLKPLLKIYYDHVND